jgi:hypothetical protein
VTAPQHQITDRAKGSAHTTKPWAWRP